jgi:DNA-binding NarL/FixJ family response regulator
VITYFLSPFRIRFEGKCSLSDGKRQFLYGNFRASIRYWLDAQNSKYEMTVTSMTQTIQIAIIDEEILFRKGMTQVVEGWSDIDLIQQAGKNRELIQQLKGSKDVPEVILMGLRKAEKKELEDIQQLLKKYPNTKLILLTSNYSKAFLLRALKLGVAACLEKYATPEQIETCIRQVMEKGFFYTDSILSLVRESLTHKMDGTVQGNTLELSDREKDVLKHICEQYTNSEIAEALNLSIRTIEWYRLNLLRTLKCKNTAGLVAIAISKNLVTIDFTKFES